jgi:hypothetical protein
MQESIDNGYHIEDVMSISMNDMYYEQYMEDEDAEMRFHMRQEARESAMEFVDQPELDWDDEEACNRYRQEAAASAPVEQFISDDDLPF